jgi:glycogen debranching enzyme
VVERAESRLWTRLGPRTLAPDEPDYAGTAEDDALAHQGAAWPWLTGAFIEAWVRVNGGTPEVRAEARARFLHPLVHHLDEAGLGHVSERADGDAPHLPRGHRFHALGLAELVRVHRGVLGEVGPRRRRARVDAELPMPLQVLESN